MRAVVVNPDDLFGDHRVGAVGASGCAVPPMADVIS
jgi:hypothetical protein